MNFLSNVETSNVFIKYIYKHLLYAKRKVKVDLKLNIQKTKIMASGPIISWQIDGETMEMVIDFIFLGSKIIAGGDCSMNLKDTCSLEEKL